MAFSFKFPDSARLFQSLSSATLSARLAPLLPVLLGVLALFWLGGQLVFRLSPAPQKILPLTVPMPTADAGRVASRHWFGEVPSPEQQGAQAAAALTLLGVYSSGNASTDFALIGDGAQVVPWRVGQEHGGWTLLAVLPTSVRVSQGGVERRIDLARPAVGSESLVAVSPAVEAPGVSVPTSDASAPSAAASGTAAISTDFSSDRSRRNVAADSNPD